MDKLNPWRVGSATGLTAATVSLVCSAAVYLFTEGDSQFRQLMGARPGSDRTLTSGVDLNRTAYSGRWVICLLDPASFPFLAVGYSFPSS